MTLYDIVHVLKKITSHVVAVQRTPPVGMNQVCS